MRFSDSGRVYALSSERSATGLRGWESGIIHAHSARVPASLRALKPQVFGTDILNLPVKTAVAVWLHTHSETLALKPCTL